MNSSANDLMIGIDAGTSMIKAVVFTLDGQQVAIASRRNEYTLVDGAGAEQDLERTWQLMLETLVELVQQTPDLPQRTAAISITGQGDGTWLMDAEGAACGPALLWLDARASGIANDITRQESEPERYSLTGCGLAGCQQGPQLRWLQQHRADTFAAARHAMHCKDWLYYRLSGEIATDPSEGVFSFGDFRTRQYSDTVLEILGLRAHRSLLPELVDGTEVQGSLQPQAAQLTGLLAGTPVVLGFIDVICTALGSGLYDQTRDAGVSIVGTTGMHMRFVRSAEQVHLNTEHTGYTMPLPVPGAYAQMQSNLAATLNIDWLLDLAADLLAQVAVLQPDAPSIERGQLLQLLDGWVAASDASNRVLYQPYISEAGERGPFIDAQARASFLGLSTRHGFADIARAVMEGLCLAARDCYQAMGPRPDVVSISGGAAKSKQLLSMLGAALETPVMTCQRDEAGAAGAAMIAAVGCGHYASMDACARDWVSPLLSPGTDPEPAQSARFNALYPPYAAAHKQLQPIWQALAEAKV